MFTLILSELQYFHIIHKIIFKTCKVCIDHYTDLIGITFVFPITPHSRIAFLPEEDIVAEVNRMVAEVTRYELLESLAHTLSDYRQGEITPINPEHVERWLKQFDPADQMIILSEMNFIMKRFYLSRIRIKRYLQGFLKKCLIAQQDPLTVLPHIHFLNIQLKGSSQKTLLGLIDEILQEDYAYDLARCKHQPEKICVYIDDASYTGNNLRYDLTYGPDARAWIPNESLPDSKLLIYSIVMHQSAIDYARPFIANAAIEKGIKYTHHYSILVDNTNSAQSKIEVLWPQEPDDNLRTHPYIAELRTIFSQRNWSGLFRSPHLPRQETLFSSLQNRRVVEQAFLQKGIQLVTNIQKPAPSIRPLGYMKLQTLGFGTFLTTYRNIANNCPLVLWWGDPTMPASHPFSRWYPLLPRKTNVQQDPFFMV
jgi:hypothetical protein